MKVFLATSADWPDLFADDHPLREALRARDIDARAAIWDDPGVAWGSADLVVLRSIWDYTRRREEFLTWVRATEREVRIHNPARVVEWNSHKRYLRDLDAAGIPVVPTEWLDAGTTADAAAIARARGWRDLVVKPCVSAGARNTVRGEPWAVQPHIDALLPERDLMVQPYLAETEAHGERSLVHFGGSLSHVMRKEPALAVADYASWNVTPVDPAPEEVELARAVVEHLGWLLYARVDCITTEGRARVMEVELIEPQLFLRMARGAADRLADLVIAAARAS